MCVPKICATGGGRTAAFVRLATVTKVMCSLLARVDPGQLHSIKHKKTADRKSYFVYSRSATASHQRILGGLQNKPRHDFTGQLGLGHTTAGQPRAKVPRVPPSRCLVVCTRYKLQVDITDSDTKISWVAHWRAGAAVFACV